MLNKLQFWWFKGWFSTCPNCRYISKFSFEYPRLTILQVFQKDISTISHKFHLILSFICRLIKQTATFIFPKIGVAMAFTTCPRHSHKWLYFAGVGTSNRSRQCQTTTPSPAAGRIERRGVQRRLSRRSAKQATKAGGTAEAATARELVHKRDSDSRDHGASGARGHKPGWCRGSGGRCDRSGSRPRRKKCLRPSGQGMPAAKTATKRLSRFHALPQRNQVLQTVSEVVASSIMTAFHEFAQTSGALLVSSQF